MPPTMRRSYKASFKLEVIAYAEEHGNRAAGRKFGISEKVPKDWQKQKPKLSDMKKSKKANRGCKPRWVQLEDVLQDWILTQRAACRVWVRRRSDSRLWAQLKSWISTDSVVVHPDMPVFCLESISPYVPALQCVRSYQLMLRRSLSASETICASPWIPTVLLITTSSTWTKSHSLLTSPWARPSSRQTAKQWRSRPRESQLYSCACLLRFWWQATPYGDLQT